MVEANVCLSCGVAYSWRIDGIPENGLRKEMDQLGCVRMKTMLPPISKPIRTPTQLFGMDTFPDTVNKCFDKTCFFWKSDHIRILTYTASQLALAEICSAGRRICNPSQRTYKTYIRSLRPWWVYLIFWSLNVKML